MAFKLTIDKEKCAGCGSCAMLCPESFKMNKDGKAQTKQETLEDLDCEQQAESMCPVQAIKISKVWLL